MITVYAVHSKATQSRRRHHNFHFHHFRKASTGNKPTEAEQSLHLEALCHQQTLNKIPKQLCLTKRVYIHTYISTYIMYTQRVLVNHRWFLPTDQE